MAFPKYREDDLDRRIENSAAILDEYQPSLTEIDRRASSPQGESTLASMAEAVRMTQAELIAMREWVQSVIKECDERLSREMTLVYRLNEQRTRVLAVKYMSKGEAAEWAKAVPPGELLGLDSVYGGMLLCDSYVFVSERTLAEGLREYASAPALLNGLIRRGRYSDLTLAGR
jgi:hypothetical protein